MYLYFYCEKVLLKKYFLEEYLNVIMNMFYLVYVERIVYMIVRELYYFKVLWNSYKNWLCIS